MSKIKSFDVTQTPVLTRTVRRQDVLTHLNEFRRDIDKYVNALPGVMIGIPFTEVIHMSLNLSRQIEILRGALIEGMLQQGLSPHRDADCPPLSSWDNYLSTLNPRERSAFPDSTVRSRQNPMSYVGQLYPTSSPNRSRSVDTSFRFKPKERNMRSIDICGIDQDITHCSVSGDTKYYTAKNFSTDNNDTEDSENISQSLLQRPMAQSTPLPLDFGHYGSNQMNDESDLNISIIPGDALSFLQNQ